jgi:hypothetical protein
MIFVFHAITISFKNDPIPVMHLPVDQGRGQGVVHVKDFAPFPEGSIRGDHNRSNFITGGDNLEQQIGTMLVDGQIAQLIEDGTEIRYSPGTINTRIRRRLPVYCDLGVTARDLRARFEREVRYTRGWGDRADVAGALIPRARRATLSRLCIVLSVCFIAGHPRQLPGCG